MGIEVIGGAGDVSAGSLERGYEPAAYGVGDCCKYNGGSALLCRCLHLHCNGGRDTDHKIYLVCLEVRDNLTHNACVCIAVVIVDGEINAELGAARLETVLQALCYLVE